MVGGQPPGGAGTWLELSLEQIQYNTWTVVPGHRRPYSQLRDPRQLAQARPLLQGYKVSVPVILPGLSPHQGHNWEYGGGRGLGWVPGLLSRLLKVAATTCVLDKHLQN